MKCYVVMMTSVRICKPPSRLCVLVLPSSLVLSALTERMSNEIPALASASIMATIVAHLNESSPPCVAAGSIVASFSTSPEADTDPEGIISRVWIIHVAPQVRLKNAAALFIRCGGYSMQAALSAFVLVFVFRQSGFPLLSHNLG